jgi:murein DD-endopeptidase MepM/ murein hydrolase activator NlpD
MTRKSAGIRLMVIPEDGGETRSLLLSRRAAGLWLLLGVSGAFVLAAMVLTWWFFALEAWRGWRREALLDSLQAERAQILSLATQLSRVEEEYEHLRSLFGPTAAPVAPDLWLPPTGAPGEQRPGTGTLEGENVPSGWPLAQAGYVTQALVEGGEGAHPGLDIAVATDSYIRAAGGARVLRTGEDPIYGRFIVLEHGQGYQTVYAHASMVLVEQGQRVRRGEVIGLTGSSGRSTAPHLHFEVLLNGLPVDTFTLVEQPG